MKNCKLYVKCNYKLSDKDNYIIGEIYPLIINDINKKIYKVINQKGIIEWVNSFLFSEPFEEEFNNCCFCHIGPDREKLFETNLCYAIFDIFPVTLGHVLIIPKRHISNYFDLSLEEQNDCWLVINKVKQLLDKKYNPDGYNIGININESAGQTVMHCHIHIFPRYIGDIENPRGGIRGIIPNKKEY